MFNHQSTKYQRKQDGQAIFEQGRVTELSVATGEPCYTVNNGEGKVYFVDEGTCSCPDYAFRRDEMGEQCKHIYAVAAFVAAKPPRYQITESIFLDLVDTMEKVAASLEQPVRLTTSAVTDSRRLMARTLRTAIQNARAN